MTVERKGTSPLALLADDLPVRSRIGLAVVGADLAVTWLKSSPNFAAAYASFDLARRWFDGERFVPDQLEDSLDPPSGVEIDKALRSISPDFMRPVTKAAEYLKRESRASFAELKRVISQ